jgi:F-type H+-transporting ATPase subunit epsilon
MKLTIAKIDEVLFQGTVKSVTCPGGQGELTVLPGHLPLVTILKKGKVKILTSSQEETEVEMEKGILEVTKEEVIILI